MSTRSGATRRAGRVPEPSRPPATPARANRQGGPPPRVARPGPTGASRRLSPPLESRCDSPASQSRRHLLLSAPRGAGQKRKGPAASTPGRRRLWAPRTVGRSGERVTPPQSGIAARTSRSICVWARLGEQEEKEEGTFGRRKTAHVELFCSVLFRDAAPSPLAKTYRPWSYLRNGPGEAQTVVERPSRGEGGSGRRGGAAVAAELGAVRGLGGRGRAGRDGLTPGSRPRDRGKEVEIGGRGPGALGTEGHLPPLLRRGSVRRRRPRPTHPAPSQSTSPGPPGPRSWRPFACCAR